MNITPQYTCHISLTRIPLDTIVPYIHWTFFFMAWRLNGKYDGIDEVCECTSCKTGWLQKFSAEERVKAEEALKLYKDALAMLRNFRDDASISINASLGIYPAYSNDDDLVFVDGEKQISIPVLRQQTPSGDGFCYSLADFLKPEDDYCGVFATTVTGTEVLAAQYEKNDDIYQSILIKTLSDRIAEATAEWLHYQVRTHYWAYAPNEPENIPEMWKVHYKGIRPAIGYPSLPDQSIIFDLDPLIHFTETGIMLTENGAMYPNASVCGLYFAHPKSKYFNIGRIDDEQFGDYARRRNKSKEEMRKWLASNL
jgi:5-methyltetrahydrofolate--homocysteine methyltransferase